MGSSFSTEDDHSASPANLAWPEDKRRVYSDVMAAGNPKVIDYKKWKFPIEDPVKMVV